LTKKDGHCACGNLGVAALTNAPNKGKLRLIISLVTGLQIGAFTVTFKTAICGG